MADRELRRLRADLGRPPCLTPAPPPSPWPRSSGRSCSGWPAPAPRPRRWPSAPASSCGPPTRTGPPTCKSPPSWAATTTPSGPGGGASPRRALRACATCPGPADRRPFPPSQRLRVVELATQEDPAAAGCPSGSWSLDDLALAVLREAGQQDRLREHLRAAGQDLAGGRLPALPLLPMSRS